MKKKKPWSKSKIYLCIVIFLILDVAVVFSLVSDRWSAYGFIENDSKQNLLYIANSSTEDGCHRRAQKKLESGINMSRFEQANSYFCGKYCIEVPLVELTRSMVYCMMIRASQFP